MENTRKSWRETTSMSTMSKNSLHYVLKYQVTFLVRKKFLNPYKFLHLLYSYASYVSFWITTVSQLWLHNVLASDFEIKILPRFLNIFWRCCVSGRKHRILHTSYFYICKKTFASTHHPWGDFPINMGHIYLL